MSYSHLHQCESYKTYDDISETNLICGKTQDSTCSSLGNEVYGITQCVTFCQQSEAAMCGKEDKSWPYMLYRRANSERDSECPEYLIQVDRGIRITA